MEGRLWQASLQLQEDPDDGESAATVLIALRGSGATEDAAKAALAEALPERVFLKTISEDVSKNPNDYNTPAARLL